MVELLAQRYHCLPPDVEEADGEYLLRHIAILRLAGHFDEQRGPSTKGIGGE